jgi:SAM-dependent methyltransferase
MWQPRFACPECGSALASLTQNGDDRVGCARCDCSYGRVDGIWRFLRPARQSQLEAFVRQYRAIREQEGRRSVPPAYYRNLPSVPAGDPHEDDWRIRQETFRHLLGHVLAAGAQPSRVLDLGAGSGWLSHRLATLGHQVAAVDAIDDDADGLGAVRHYASPIVAVQADFDALPFVPHQFDLVVFNGSLHYSPDPATTLARAHRMLDSGGTLVVMDSPMFQVERDGAAMAADLVRRFASEFGLTEIIQRGSGYLTFGGLARIAATLSLASRFVPSRGPLVWRMRRRLARLRLGRQPASFGLWMAR